MGTRARASFPGRSGVWLVGIGLVLGVACGGESKDPPLNPTGSGATGGRGLTGVGGAAGRGGGSAGKGGSAGRGGGSSGDAGDGAGGVPDVGGPIVEVTSPPALASPDDGDVLVDAEATVTCEVRQAPGGAPVDPSTVTIQLLDADGNVVEEALAAPTTTPNEYSAVVILAKVTENGVVGFLCSASDTDAVVGTDTVESFVDHGPLIALVAPAEGSVHPLASVAFEFTVTEAPVARRDTGAAVDSVVLSVDGVEVDVGNPDADGTYQVPVDLSDTNVFSAEAGPVAFTIVARTARGGVRTLTSSFILDDEGPLITIETPDDGDVVGSRIPVTFSVTDMYSAVDPESVTVAIAGVVTRYDGGSNWELVGDRFTCFLDSRETGNSDFQATISIRARDEAGNDAQAVTRLVYLDNHPAVVDLVPGNVRETREITNGVECSKSFDPLGPWAPEDLGVIGNFLFPRALIWEETNDFGQAYKHMSGTNDATAHLFFNPTPDAPLLVDNDDDPECDDVDDAIKLSDYGVDLKPVDDGGNSWWGAGDEMAEPPMVGCTPGSETTPPDKRCVQESSDLSRVICHNGISEETMQHPPVIYAVGVDPSGLECTGTDWEMGSSTLGEGWLCFAARVEDYAGNVGISRAIRLCYDDPDTAGQPGCVADPMGMTAPSCMDNCTPPPAFQRTFIRYF
jgi:hypothetical protein